MFGAKKVSFEARILRSAFDAESFGQTEYNQTNDTKYPIIPEAEYNAVVKSFKFRQLDNGSVVMDVVWTLDSEEIRTLTGMKEPSVKQGVFLDMNESGSLDFSEGKNVKLGRLREALGLNKPGQPFSFNMLVGRPARLKTKNRKDGEDTFADVKEVTALS